MSETLTGEEVETRVLLKPPFSSGGTSFDSAIRQASEGSFAVGADPRYLCLLSGPEEGRSLDLMRLRWMFRGGVPPVVFAPSTVQEIYDLGCHAIEVANAFGCTTFLLIDEALDSRQAKVDVDRDTEPVRPPNAPPLPVDLPEEERSLRAELAKFSPEHPALQMHVLDRDPDASAKPEWLVISYSEASNAAAEAVTQAREQGVRVNHLMLKSLLPIPEPVIMRHAMGIKHIVVAERNQGELAQEVRRMLPQIGVVPAAYSTGPVPCSLVLERLLHTPRCC